MAAEVELDSGAVAAGQHQPVIGRIVDAGVGIAGDDDAGGDVAPGVVGGVVQGGQHQPVIGRIVDAVVGIAGDDDAGGYVATGLSGGVVKGGEHLGKVVARC